MIKEAKGATSVKEVFVLGYDSCTDYEYHGYLIFDDLESAIKYKIQMLNKLISKLYKEGIYRGRTDYSSLIYANENPKIFDKTWIYVNDDYDDGDICSYTISKEYIFKY